MSENNIQYVDTTKEGTNNRAVESKNNARLQGFETHCNQITMVDKDNRLKSNGAWIKWMKLKDVSSLKYAKNWYEKPGHGEDMKKRIRSVMTSNDRAKQKRTLEGAEPKRA